MALGKKTGGRKRGTPNKSTALNVLAILEARGISPVASVLDLLEFLEPREQVRVWLTLQEYLQPKARHTAGESESLPVPDFSDISNSELLRIIRDGSGQEHEPDK